MEQWSETKQLVCFLKRKKVERVKTVRKENNTWNCQRQGGNLREWGMESRDRQGPRKQSRPCSASTGVCSQVLPRLCAK